MCRARFVMQRLQLVVGMCVFVGHCAAQCRGGEPRQAGQTPPVVIIISRATHESRGQHQGREGGSLKSSARHRGTSLRCSKTARH